MIKDIASFIITVAFMAAVLIVAIAVTTPLPV